MATLQASLSGLNASNAYRRSGWPGDRRITLKTPGSIEQLIPADLQASWTRTSGPETTDTVTKNFLMCSWMVPGDFEADDYVQYIP